MGSEIHRYTVQVNIEDEGVELSRVVGRVADIEPDFLSVCRDGSTALSGRTAAELKLECTSAGFSSILETLDERNVSVGKIEMEADVTRFAVVLIGDRLEIAVTEALQEAKRTSRSADVSLTVDGVEFAWQGDHLSEGVALVRIRTDAETISRAVELLRAPISGRNLRMIEPLETTYIG